MNDKISVIVPCYNVQNYIRRTIKSICNQSYENIEIIAVDDGSKDETLKKLKELQSEDSRIRVILKHNEGVTKARLTGVLNATGDWIGFVDGDDEIDSGMYEHLLKNAYIYNARISHCGYRMCFSDGRVNYFYNTGYLAQQDKITALKELLSGSRIEPGLCNKLFHKTLFHSLLQGNRMDLNIKINEDLLMNFYLFNECDKSVFEDFCPYSYLVRSGSASRAPLNRNKIFDPIKVRKIILEQSEMNIRQIALRSYISTCINSYNATLVDSNFHAERKQIRKLIAAQKQWFCTLNKRKKCSAYMILYCPEFYGFLQKFYALNIRKEKYN